MNGFWHEPMINALAAGLAVWLATAAGAAWVFVHRMLGERSRAVLIGAATGVMLAVIFELACSSRKMAHDSLVPLVIGFAAGSLILYAADTLLPHLHPGLRREEAEGVPSHWASSVLLVAAMVLHNIPEGLTVGVSFGAAGMQAGPMTTGDATTMSLAIGIHNMIEGMIVAIPLCQTGMAPFRAFLWGQGTGLVEPVAAVLGASLVTHVSATLPYALAFAGGAMLYVVLDELVPEIRRSAHCHKAILGAVAGFVLMIALSVALP
jgi:ZIP family zinc transporter